MSAFSLINAQKSEVKRSSSINIDRLPEYVIVTSQNTKFLGGINLTIDYKRSNYRHILKKLSDLLQDGNKLRIRNQTDLLNAMSNLGFEYVDSYNAATISYDTQKDGEDHTVSYRVNMIFRKKEKK